MRSLARPAVSILYESLQLLFRLTTLKCIEGKVEKNLNSILMLCVRVPASYVVSANAHNSVLVLQEDILLLSCLCCCCFELLPESLFL